MYTDIHTKVVQLIPPGHKGEPNTLVVYTGGASARVQERCVWRPPLLLVQCSYVGSQRTLCCVSSVCRGFFPPCFRRRCCHCAAACRCFPSAESHSMLLKKHSWPALCPLRPLVSAAFHFVRRPRLAFVCCFSIKLNFRKKKITYPFARGQLCIYT